MVRPTKEIDTSTFAGLVAEKIRGKRERKKLSVHDVAEKAGVPDQTWYNWERGRHLPLAALPAIAAALSIRPRDLLP